MSNTNFLIGRGELLTRPIKGPSRPHTKAEVYTLFEAQNRLMPQITSVASALDDLPQDACPRDFAVARLTLNPSYIAKSFFPSRLLQVADLTPLGSRTVQIKPERWTKKATPKECTTTELFVAGKRSAFRKLAQTAKDIANEPPAAIELARVELFSEFPALERIRTYGSSNERFFEVGMHLLPNDDSEFIQMAFERYAKSIDMKIHSDLRFKVGNLWFVPAEGPRSNIERLAQFAFIRVIRPLPKLRGVRPVTRAGGVPINCQLPQEGPLSSLPKAAIFDGGLPQPHPLAPWLGAYHILDPNAQDDPDGVNHGLAVTSAFLFGPIQPGKTASRPFAPVDHLRVLDKESDNEDPLELYRTLGHIEQALLSRQYEFVNLSLGPDLPMEDEDIHAWTSVIDNLLADGDTFMTVAVGNNGENDRSSGNARIQVPADCVNAVSVGSADSTDHSWARAPYSAIGPGRSPGVVKPDLMAFGGSAESKYFHVLGQGDRPSLVPCCGTSFASPYLLRSAVGVRAILGDDLSALAIRALLIHGSIRNGHDKAEVGWGKIPEDPLDIITCPPGVARIVYQGELTPGKYLRAQIPLPKEKLIGNVKVKATFCYACAVDPQDACSYTRAGLEVTFRPKMTKIKPGKKNADTTGFFDMKQYIPESERRSDMGKWETVLHNEKSMRASSLDHPVFDVHYNAREAGSSTRRADKIKYALIITLQSPKNEDIFNGILQAYPKILAQIQPKVSLPIRI